MLQNKAIAQGKAFQNITQCNNYIVNLRQNELETI